jgi:hypothetical protein
MPLAGLFFALVAGLLLFMGIRYLTYVQVEGHLYTSYSLFNNRLYTLDINAPVFTEFLKQSYKHKGGVQDLEKGEFYFKALIHLEKEREEP